MTEPRPSFAVHSFFFGRPENYSAYINKKEHCLRQWRKLQLPVAARLATKAKKKKISDYSCGAFDTDLFQSGSSRTHLVDCRLLEPREQEVCCIFHPLKNPIIYLLPDCPVDQQSHIDLSPFRSFSLLP